MSDSGKEYLDRLGAVSALVFARQMLNIPVSSGVSGHFIGGVFAAPILGPWGAMLSMALVLTLQAYFLGDGRTLSRRQYHQHELHRRGRGLLLLPGGISHLPASGGSERGYGTFICMLAAAVMLVSLGLVARVIASIRGKMR